MRDDRRKPPPPAALLAAALIAASGCALLCDPSWSADLSGLATVSGGASLAMCFQSTEAGSASVAQDYVGEVGLRFAIYAPAPGSHTYIGYCPVPTSTTAPCGELVLQLAQPIRGAGAVAVTGCSLTLACGTAGAFSAASPGSSCSGQVFVSDYSDPAQPEPDGSNPLVIDRQMSGSFAVTLSGPTPTQVIGSQFAVTVYEEASDCPGGGGGGGLDD
jgi:hypothetical protein